jgi:hypothetical protein
VSAARSRAALAGALLAALAGCDGGDLPDGAIAGGPRLAAAEAATAADEQILFGDLHVHTTWSIDAYLYGLPLFAGEGAHPPADACDFARHCAGLDFYALTDHAEGLTPERWRASIASVRDCNARAGDPAHPDMVAFAGWEWTQTGATPDTHFGHKNVILRGTGDVEVPARPISALADDTMQRARYLWAARMAEAALSVGPGRPYAAFLAWIRTLTAVPFCADDAAPDDTSCHENAPTPEELFEKLARWGPDALVIPHGLAWGIHAPAGARIDLQLAGARGAPEQQRLLEVYSGHGSSEPYSRAAAAADAQAASGVCPAPTRDFLPCCWQAGEIVRARCGALPAPECETRVEEARKLALAAGREPEWVLPGTDVADWLDCDQPRGGAFKPVSSPRPGMSAQAAAAAGFRFGFVASSDTHSARAGSGYKQVRRKGMSDARGLASGGVGERALAWLAGAPEDPARAVPSPPGPSGFRNLLDVERGASFLYPGGLAAVHAKGRDRGAIWDALRRREVYGTSGPRILLFFELTSGAERAPMGSEVKSAASPRFEARAVGSRVEQPGCSDASTAALGAERLASLCLGECHHPGDTRHRIAAIEVVRIRQQRAAGEDVAPLVEDPWLRFECPPDPVGCAVEFEDADFAASGRSAAYYVRALQEPTPAVNGANLRARYDADGNALAVSPCYGDARTGAEDDCLAPVQERAWSSPIYVDPL